MRILLVAATLFEIRPFLDKLPVTGQADPRLTTYRLKNHTLDVLIPGVGMVPTAYALGRELSRRHYDLAINAGIAGTYNPSIPLGAVVQVVEDCIPELGAEDGKNFLSVFDLGLADPDAVPYKGGRLKADQEALAKLFKGQKINGFQRVRGITSNTVRGDGPGIERMRERTHADVESMEGAAFLYCCLSEGTPCVQLRSISNRVEERNKAAWKLDLALKNLNRALMELVVDIYDPLP